MLTEKRRDVSGGARVQLALGASVGVVASCSYCAGFIQFDQWHRNWPTGVLLSSHTSVLGLAHA